MNQKSSSNGDFLQVEESSYISQKVLIEIMDVVIKRNKSLRFSAPGFSMTPFIRDGDIITVSPLSDLPISLGRIVAFLNPGNKKLTVHRVIGKENSSYYIKGDNSFCYDGLIPQDNILGYVSKIERNGRNVSFDFGLGRFIAVFSSRARIPSLAFVFLRVIKTFCKRFLK